ncbi:MAG: hypothetical protein MUO94_01105 [Thermoplasmata archaeon]|nr:hypothetical protein [Thermoplasmata archaeon]
MVFSVKKWFMLQMWRVQQIAAILSLVMLAITDALLVYDKVSWRSGIFETPYTGVTALLLVIGLAIWLASIAWDTKLKMWREQMTVLVEKNPFNKERMAPKEIVMNSLLWLPMLESIGRNDPKVRDAAIALREWVDKAVKEDPVIARDVKELLRFIDVKETSVVEIKE